MTKHILLLFLLNGFGLKAQSISANSGWTASVSSSEIAEAGLDYTGTYESASNATVLNVTGGSWLSSYYVSVDKIDMVWHSKLSVWVKRTGDGSGGILGSISGGTSYFQLSNAKQSFYSGAMGLGTSRTNVPVQYQIRGLSVLIPAKQYTMNVRYTVSD